MMRWNDVVGTDPEMTVVSSVLVGAAIAVAGGVSVATA